MSYVTYDNLGIVEIRCMNCGTPIVMRSYKKVMVKSVPPKEVTILATQQLSCFRKRKFNLGDHSYVEVMLCDRCVNLSISPDKMEQAIEAGWLDTWKNQHKTEGEIKGLKKSLPILSGSEKDRLNKEKKHGL